MHSKNFLLKVMLTAVTLVLTSSLVLTLSILSTGQKTAYSPKPLNTNLNTLNSNGYDEWLDLGNDSPEISGTPPPQTRLISNQLNAGGIGTIGADSVIFENDSVFTIEGVKDELQSEGEWIKVSPEEIDPDGVTEGEGIDEEINTDYVWRPYNVEPGWSPYTNGYWRNSNQGWFWVSYYSWGWRTTHYGRWWFSPVYRWVWSPGFIFAPAWVVWMYDDGYCGWYPISPRVNCNYYTYNYYDYSYNYSCHKMRYRTKCWTFVHKPKFCDPVFPYNCQDPSLNGTIARNCKFTGEVSVRDDRVKVKGPDVKVIESSIGSTIGTKNIDRYSNTKQISSILDRNDNTRNDKVRNDKVRNDKVRNDNSRDDRAGVKDKSNDRSDKMERNDKVERNDKNTHDNNTKTDRNDTKKNDTQRDTKKDTKRDDSKQNNDTKRNDTKKSDTKRNDSHRNDTKKSDTKRNDQKQNDSKQNTKQKRVENTPEKKQESKHETKKQETRQETKKQESKNQETKQESKQETKQETNHESKQPSEREKQTNDPPAKKNSGSKNDNGKNDNGKNDNNSKNDGNTGRNSNGNGRGGK